MAPLVVNRGKQIIADRLRAVGTEPSYVAWGTGVTAEAITQTALITEVVDTARATGTASTVTTTTTSDTFQVVGTLTATTARAITEVGLLDAVTTGNLFVRGVFTVINLSTGDSIQFTIKVVFS